MLPKIIVHNSVSLDGSLTNFEPNMELHYDIAGRYKPDAHLIGSRTVKAGVELYSAGVPVEEESDFIKPERDKNLPYWVIVDSRGLTKGLLHIMRRFEYSKDVIVLVSETTPKIFIDYLKKRNYGYHVIGKNHVHLKKALELLVKKYDIKTILTDTGKILGSLLLDEGLVTEVSMLVHPVIVGDKADYFFSTVKNSHALKMKKCEVMQNGYVWIGYNIKK